MTLTRCYLPAVVMMVAVLLVVARGDHRIDGLLGKDAFLIIWGILQTAAFVVYIRDMHKRLRTERPSAPLRDEDK